MALEQGRIVWARVADTSGRNPKFRPLVIVTRTEEITSTDSIQAVATTMRVDDPLPANHVKLPWHRNRHPRTRLKSPCVAVCDWIVDIQPSDVEEIGGSLPMAQLQEVLSRIEDRRRALADQDRAIEPPDTSSSGSRPENPL